MKSSNHTSDSLKKENRKNVPISSKKSVLKEHLVRYGGKRKYVSNELVKEFAKKNYDVNGKGITILDMKNEYKLSKKTIQRKIKHLLKNKTLFTAQDLKKENICIRGIKRERPQRYYATEYKSKLIERVKNNVPKDTTEYRDPLGPLKAHNFEMILRLLSSAILYIHKLQIHTWIDIENYELLQDLKLQDNSRVAIERIGNYTVEFRIHPNGSVMIYVSCSYQPFRLFNDQDVSDILVFLGRIEEKLKNVLGDNRDTVTAPVNRWILKCCDVNKDIEIEGAAQLTLHDIQIPFGEMALRAYVKPIGDKVFYRVEQSLTPNKPIREALESLQKEVIIDKHSFALQK